VDNIGYVGQGYPSDEVRAANVCRLISEGHLAQIVLGGDVCLKQHLRVHGGKGYAHVQRNFLPLLTKGGIKKAAIYEMTVANPARLLTGPRPAPNPAGNKSRLASRRH